ncbi:hypothetical protein WN51_06505 [Melipona quadrifasciata]|uniref:Uncharacterized protein n=1 Tax=Melipona quadrifasciata TaxID=166423 RepID=A0A0N0U3K9_9HYME|nr:hypothetical protein WN51_06505 [Melipona quadrifasciata]
MNSKGESLPPDIDDAHNAIDSNIIKRTMISQETRERGDSGGILAASNGKRENGDVDYDYSYLAPETDVGAIDDLTTIPVKNLSAFYKDDETEACNEEDQQLDKVSNVLDHKHIRESTDSNLSATDATSQPIAGISNAKRSRWAVCSGEFPCYNTYGLGTGTSGVIYCFLRTLSWNVSPENLGHMAVLSSKQETNKALDRELMHGTNFPEHVRSTGQRDDSGRQGVSGPSCPTLDPRFSETEGRGTEKTFGLSFGFQNRIISTFDS